MSLAEAREKALEMLREIDSGGDPKARLRLAPQDFKGFTEEFFRKHVDIHCKEKTAREYRRLYEVELLPAFGSRRLSDIHEYDVRELLDDIFIRRGHAILANRARALLSKIFSFAVERGVLRGHLLKNIAAHQMPEEQPRILTESEIRLLWSALQSEDERVAAALKLLLFTAQKPGAVQKLRWDALQLNEWTVASYADGGEHRIPLATPAMELLVALRRKRRSDGCYVFGTDSERAPAFLNAVLHRLARDSRSTHSWRPGDVRRTVEFGLRSLSVRPDVIEQILGRRPVSPLRYREKSGYDYRPDVEAALSAWGEKVLRIVGGGDEPRKKTLRRDNVVQLFR
jgi:integrase